MSIIRLSRRFPLVLLLALIWGSLSAEFAARADESTIEDPDDSPSRVDIEQVRQGHYFEYVLYRVTAFEKWEPVDLDEGRLVFSFNIDDDATVERRTILTYRGGGGTQLRLRTYDEDGKKVGKGVHRRPNQRSVEIWLRRWQLDHVSRYRMFVTVETKDDADCADACIDRAPDSGSILHKLKKLCLSEEPTIIGTRDDDVIHGTKRRDIIAARAGDDEIKGLKGGDKVCGGPGSDVINAGSGYLFLRGGRGGDRITATGPRPAPCDDNASCAYPEAFLMGGPGRDTLVGGKRHESLTGGAGDDRLSGRGWSDRLDGGPNRDVLRGGRGQDRCVKGERMRSC